MTLSSFNALLSISPKTWDIVILILQFLAAILMCADYWLSPDKLKSLNDKLLKRRSNLKPGISFKERLSIEKSRTIRSGIFLLIIAVVFSTLLFLIFKILGVSWNDSAVAGLQILSLAVTFACVLLTSWFALKMSLHSIDHFCLSILNFCVGAHKGAIFGLGAGFLLVSFLLRVLRIYVSP